MYNETHAGYEQKETTMQQVNNSRRWATFWLVAAILIVPFVIAPLLFTALDRQYPYEFGVILAMLGLFIWLRSQGAGLRPIDKDTVVIVRDAMDNLIAHTRRSYLFIPIINKVEAILPTYPLTFEFSVDDIDTHTPGLARISKIRVRATCQLTHPEQFFRTSQAYVARIKQMEDQERLKRTETLLWRKLLEEVAHVVVDDTVRDVVWKWKIFLQDQQIVDALDYAPTKEDGSPNLEGDPYSLSRNRKPLADLVKAAVRASLERQKLGFQIAPLVFEKIEIDQELVKRATGDRKKEREKATHEAALLADAIRERGAAEAEVRATTLAKLLDVLIKEYKIPYNDPMVATVVRAVLYSDGEMIWSGVLDRGASGDGNVKAA